MYFEKEVNKMSKNTFVKKNYHKYNNKVEHYADSWWYVEIGKKGGYRGIKALNPKLKKWFKKQAHKKVRKIILW